MKRIISLCIICVLVAGPVFLYSQSGAQKNEQAGINERVTVLEKGQAGLKAKTGDAKKKLLEQKRLTDSVCEKVMNMEKELKAQDDSIKARMSTLVQTQDVVNILNQRLFNRKMYGITSFVVVTLCFVAIFIILVLMNRKINTLKSALNETVTKINESLSREDSQLQVMQSKVNNTNQDLQQLKDKHGQDHQILDDKMNKFSKELDSATESLRAEGKAMGEEIGGTLDKKLTSSVNALDQKFESLCVRIEGLDKKLASKGE